MASLLIFACFFFSLRFNIHLRIYERQQDFLGGTEKIKNKKQQMEKLYAIKTGNFCVSKILMWKYLSNPQAESDQKCLSLC